MSVMNTARVTIKEPLKRMGNSQNKHYFVKNFDDAESFLM